MRCAKDQLPHLCSSNSAAHVRLAHVANAELMLCMPRCKLYAQRSYSGASDLNLTDSCHVRTHDVQRVQVCDISSCLFDWGKDCELLNKLAWSL